MTNTGTGTAGGGSTWRASTWGSSSTGNTQGSSWGQTSTTQSYSNTPAVWGAPPPTAGVAQKTGFGQTTGTGYGQGRGTTTTGFGQQQTTTGSYTGGGYGYSSKPNVPVKTHGIPFAPSVFVDQTPNGEFRQYSANHIWFFEMFKQYTVEQLRFYDYVYYGALQAPPTTTTSFSTTGQTSYSSQSMTGSRTGWGQQGVQTKEVAPWRAPVNNFADLPTAAQTQPYGALAASQIVTSSADSEAIDIKKPLPSAQLRGFSHKKSIADTLNKAYNGPPKTPGYSQLTVKRRTPSRSGADVQPSPSGSLLSPSLSSPVGHYSGSPVYDQIEEADTDALMPELRHGDLYFIPNQSEISEDSMVDNFVIGSKAGTITFLNSFKASIFTQKPQRVKFEKCYLDLFPDKEELNQTGLPRETCIFVVMNGVFPQHDEAIEDFRKVLSEFCSSNGLKLISYDPGTRRLEFLISSWSQLPVAIPTGN